MTSCVGDGDFARGVDRFPDGVAVRPGTYDPCSFFSSRVAANARRPAAKAVESAVT